MAKKPSDRYATAGELAKAVTAAAGSVTAAACATSRTEPADEYQAVLGGL